MTNGLCPSWDHSLPDSSVLGFQSVFTCILSSIGLSRDPFSTCSLEDIVDDSGVSGACERRRWGHFDLISNIQLVCSLPKINLLRPLLIKVCTFFSVVLIVIVPYSSTGFTLELNRRIFAYNDNTSELEMFLSCIYYAPLALPILALTSAYVSPCLSMILHKYVKVSISSISFPSRVTGSVLAAFTLMTFVLLYVHFGWYALMFFSSFHSSWNSC